MSPVLIVCVALALVGWWALLRKAGPGRVPVPDWRPGEWILAGLLGVYFLMMATGGGRPPEALKPEVIRAGAMFYLLMLGMVVSVVALQGHSPTALFGLRPTRPGVVLAVAVASFALTYPVVLAAGEVAAAFGYRVSERDPLVQFLRGGTTAIDWVWVVALALIIAPLAEEFIFRGFFYGVLKRYFGRWSATGVSALLFAAIHQNIPAIPMLALLAVGFTLAYERTGSLWAPIGMHAIFNSIPLGMLFFFPKWAENF